MSASDQLTDKWAAVGTNWAERRGRFSATVRSTGFPFLADETLLIEISAQCEGVNNLPERGRPRERPDVPQGGREPQLIDRTSVSNFVLLYGTH